MALDLLSFQNALCLLALPPPVRFPRKAEPGHAFRLHLNAVARARRRDIIPVFDLRRMEKVLVKVVDVFKHRLLGRYADVVDGGEMLRVLGKANTATVGNDGDIELGIV